MTNYHYASLVVDTNVSEGINRGDVIMFEAPDGTEVYGQSISRVIALPHETIEIIEGQIYIDGMKLDTFYGSYHRRGMDVEHFIEFRKSEGYNDDESELRQRFAINLDKVTLNENEYFIIGDDWFRSVDSRVFGAITSDRVIGIVLGYKK